MTGRLEPTYPRWRRNMFRYFVSVPIIAICLLFVFIVMILSFQIQVRICIVQLLTGIDYIKVEGNDYIKII